VASPSRSAQGSRRGEVFLSHTYCARRPQLGHCAWLRTTSNGDICARTHGRLTSFSFTLTRNLNAHRKAPSMCTDTTCPIGKQHVTPSIPTFFLSFSLTSLVSNRIAMWSLMGRLIARRMRAATVETGRGINATAASRKGTARGSGMATALRMKASLLAPFLVRRKRFHFSCLLL
jgi:hypothetical protein